MAPQQKSIIFRMLKVYIGVLIILTLFALVNRTPKSPSLHEINVQTHELLHSLVKTKYFRLFKANLNRQCELYVRNKICKSKSCTACRCDQKDIPLNWIKTDKVKKQPDTNINEWDNQHQQSVLNNQNNSLKQLNWTWHVEDQQNAQGEYFDLDANIESFTNYNGSTIWQMIYEQNCFTGAKGNFQSNSICKQQKVFYKVISGLHTSISTHLSRFYKNITTQMQVWADLKESEQFFVNKELYNQRVLSHPERIENLLFIYQIYLRAIKQVSTYMGHNYTIHSDSTTDDHATKELLSKLSQKLQSYEFQPFDAQLKTFFYPQNPKVHLYQRYIHNISRLMDCVECEKCRLFGKMQTYGIGTALKILLGYNDFYKRNQIVALYNAWNKISMSVEFYYQTVDAQKEETYEYDFFWLRLFATVAGAFILFMFLVQKVNVDQKVRKLFKNVSFPKEKGGKVNAQAAAGQKEA